MVEILQKTQDKNEIIKELEKRKIPVEKESVYTFLDQLLGAVASEKPGNYHY